jgi:hypothetical protein
VRRHAAGKAKKLDLLRLPEAQGGREVANEEIDPAGDDIDQRRPFALVGNIGQTPWSNAGAATASSVTRKMRTTCLTVAPSPARRLVGYGSRSWMQCARAREIR